MTQWADFFPELKATHTKDPRIFSTPWQKQPDKNKKKTYFACFVGVDGNNCYGVDVNKPWATKSEKEEEEAFYKVKQAVVYFEVHGEWPQ